MVKMKMLMVALAAVAACGSSRAQDATSTPTPTIESTSTPTPAPASSQLTRDLKTRAYIGAVADSVSTHIGLAGGGAAEANPLVNTSPAGLLLLAGVKIGITEAVNRSSWPEVDKQRFNNNVSAMWTGVSVNNLLIAASASTPVAIGGGVLVGYLLWKNGKEKIEAAEHERIFWEEGCPAIRQYSGIPDLKCIYTPPAKESKVAARSVVLKTAVVTDPASPLFEAP